MTRASRRLIHRVAAVFTGGLVLAGAVLSGPSASADVGSCGIGTEQGPNIEVSNGYYVGPNNWNSKAGGDICITTDGGQNFRVTRSTLSEWNRRGGGPNAYPRIGHSGADPRFPIPLSEIGDTQASWWTSGGAGTYNTSFDIWYNTAENCKSTSPWPEANSSSLEIMIWLNRPNLSLDWIQPIAAGITVGGRQYDLYRLTGGHAGTELIYDMKTPVTSVENFKLAPFSQDAAARGLLPGGYSLCKIHAGFEIHESGLGLKTDYFGVDVLRQAQFPGAGGHFVSGLAGRCLDDQWNSAAENNTITSYRCNPSEAQQRYTDGQGAIGMHQKCVSSLNGGTADGTPVVLATCNGTNAQKWRPGPGNTVVHAASGKCLDIPGGSTVNGVQVQIQACNGMDAQQWRAPQPADTTGAFKNDGRCMDYDQWTATDKVSIYTCNPGDQTWKVTRSTVGAMGKCLTAGATAANKPCDGSTAQSWVVSPKGHLVNYGTDLAAATPKCLVNPGGADATQLPLADCANTPAQEWQRV